MTTIASLRILLGLDSGGVKTGAANVKGELKAVQVQANQTNATLRDIGKGVGAGIGLGAGLGAFALASRGALEFAGFLTDGVKAAQEDETSVARLTQALHENVKGWDGRTDAVDAAIKSGQKLGFTDDEVRDSLTRLTAATHNMNEAIHVQNVAMDLARFKGVDLATATAALTKIEAGRFRGLADLGIVLRTGATQVEALAAVERVAAGQAKIFGDTSAGAALEAGIAMQEAGEAVGKSLVPALKEASHFARDVLAPAITLVADNLDRLAPIVGVVAAAFSAKLVVGLVTSGIELGRNTAAMVLNAIASQGAGTAVQLFATKQSLAAAAAAATTPALVAEAAAATAVTGAVTAAAVQTELFSAVALAGAPQLELFAAGEVSVAAGATALGKAAGTAATGGLAALIAGIKVVLAGVVTSGPAFQMGNDLTHKFARETAEAGFKTKSYAAALADLNGVVALGSVTQAEADAILLKVAGTMTGVSGAFNTATTSYLASERAAARVAETAARADAVSGSLSAAQIAVAQATIDAGHAHDALSAAQTAAAAAAAGDTSAAILLAAAQAADKIATDNLKAAQDALVASTLAIPPAMLGAGDGTDDLSDKLLRVQNEATIAANKIDDVTEAAFRLGTVRINGENLLPGGLSLGESFLEDQRQDQKNRDDAAARERDRQARAKVDAASAAADAKRNAAEIASAYHDKLNKAYDDVSDRAHEFYAKLHDDNLAAIRDVHDHANALLDEQEKAIRGTVDAERARVQAQRDARTLEGLRANVAGASPEDLEAAKRALGDFLADQRIAFLSSNADTQIARLEAEKKANDDIAAAAVTAENARNDAQVKALNKDLANLKDHLKDVVGAWDKAFAEIEKAAKRHHVQDIVGITPISVATGQKATSAIPAGINPAVAGVGTTAPAITVVNNFYLDGADITDLINIRQASSNSRITSGGIAG